MKDNLRLKQFYSYSYHRNSKNYYYSKNSYYYSGDGKIFTTKPFEEVIFELIEKAWEPRGYFAYKIRGPQESENRKEPYRGEIDRYYYEVQLRKNDDKRLGFTLRYIIRKWPNCLYEGFYYF